METTLREIGQGLIDPKYCCVGESTPLTLVFDSYSKSRHVCRSVDDRCEASQQPDTQREPPPWSNGAQRGQS
jgi:hypothetical protein